MHMLYIWASLIMPFVGMVFSMIAHRYAYMNTSVGMSIIFMIMAAHLLKQKRKEK